MYVPCVMIIKFGAMNKIEIGKIVNAVGMKGEIKIISYSDDPNRFENLDNVIVDDVIHDIEGVRYKGSTIIIKLKGIDDRDAAEKSKGKYVYMQEDQLDDLEEGQYYIRDLIGYDVCDENDRHIGVLSDIVRNTLQDIYVVRNPDDKEILIPGVDEFIMSVDSENKKIIVKLMEGLLEL